MLIQLKKWIVGVISLSITLNCAYAQKKCSSDILWDEGCLDIHHINTGRGDAAFFIFPDGTNMLFDIGVINANDFKKYHPLKVSELHPSDSLTSGGWLAHYIRQVLPKGYPAQVDYAVISHFHTDHYGDVSMDSVVAESGQYILTGITELAEHFQIKKLIDRGFPAYNYPVDLREVGDLTFQNYLGFIRFQENEKGMKIEQLIPGDNKQISLKQRPEKYSLFEVRNLKTNGTIWSGNENETFEYLPDSARNYYGKLFHENQLSLALKVSYGRFDYFTGGDLTGLQGYGLPEWYDVETPVANSTGEVDVATLNHHGNRDACNAFWIETLHPQVFVQQSWCSDHPGQEVCHRMTSKELFSGNRDIFATNIHEETKATYGPWFTKAYKSMEGHILIRVMPGGDEFYVFILDDKSTKLKIVKRFGPYRSRD